MTSPQLLVSGYFRSSQELYTYYMNYIPREDPGDAEVAKLAAALKKAAPNNDMALVDSTATWVRRNIRYYAVEYGEYAMRPALPSETLARRSGDCKCSAYLIKSLLEHNGIDARLVWIGTAGRVSHKWDELPALSSGNHMIAAAVVGDSIIYLDGTSSYAHPGYLSKGLRGQQAMIENGDSPLLASVPDYGNAQDTDTLTARYVIEGEDFVGTLTHSCTGDRRSKLLSTLGFLGASNANRFVEKYLRSPKKNIEVADIVTNAPLDSPIAVFSASVRERGAAKNMGTLVMLDLRPIRDFFTDIIDTKDRFCDYEESAMHRNVYDLYVELPSEKEVHLPEPFSHSDEWFKASIQYSIDGLTIHCHATFEPVAQYVPLADIEARNASLRSIIKASEKRISLE